MFHTIDELEVYVADMLGVPYEDLSGYPDSLLDFGIDSVQVMSFVEYLEAKHINVTFIQMAEQLTLPAWWQLIQAKKQGVA